MRRNNPDQRIFIIAPAGRDAPAMATVLGERGFLSCICKDPQELCSEMKIGIGMLLLTEEALELPCIDKLFETLKVQPPWSELPLIILTSNSESRLSQLLDLATTAAGGVTLLERPIGVDTLLRSVEVALHFRRRQYQVRDLLAEQQRRELQLRESEERYRSLVEQVKDYAIFRMDIGGRPISWNEGVRRVLGFEEAEFVGSDLSVIFTPEDVQTGVPRSELRQAAKTGTASNDRWLRRKDGTRFYATGVTTGLRNEAGQHVGFSKVLRDDTARKQAEEALGEAQVKLKKHAATLERIVAERTQNLRTTNEQLEAFVYSIAHDLRTPLRSMIGYSQLLTEDYAVGLDDTAQHLLSRIQGSAEFMDKLLLDLLSYGRTARAEIPLERIEAGKAWQSAVFQCSQQIEQTRAQIETLGKLPVVCAHEATLGQVLANLLSNALKFVEPGVRPHVRFWSEDRGERARLWMEDNGIGIPPEQRERVFRVFERLHGARYAGTGVGLSIVRKGVERMGGVAGLESQPGKGSRFWIELPKPEITVTAE